MSRAGVALAAVTVSILSITAGDARAESRSWAVAKSVFPASGYVYMGVNIGAIRNHSLFPRLYPAVMAQLGDVKDGLAEIKRTCGIDAVAAARDAAMAFDDNSAGVFVLSLRGVTRDQLHDCVKKLFPGEISSRKVDRFDEFWFGDGSGPRLYTAWLAPDVIAAASDLTSRPFLERMIGNPGGVGKPASVARVNTDAPLWIAYDQLLPLGQGLTIHNSSGTIDLGKRDLVLACRTTMGTADEARAAVILINQELASVQGMGLPPVLAQLVKKVKVAAAGADVTMKVSMTLQEMMALLALGLAFA
jgi:hypothetical protein